MLGTLGALETFGALEATPDGIRESGRQGGGGAGLAQEAAELFVVRGEAIALCVHRVVDLMRVEALEFGSEMVVPAGRAGTVSFWPVVLVKTMGTAGTVAV